MDKKSQIEVYVANTSQAPDINYVPTILEQELKNVTNEGVKVQKRAMYNLIYFVFYRQGIKLNKASIKKDKSGKPLIKGWNISCSHSKDLITVAISKNAKIGVDIEVMQIKVSFEQLKEKIYHNNEAHFHLNLINLFYLWTRKEAIFKMGSKIAKFIPTKIDTTKYLTTSAILEHKKINYVLSVACDKNQQVHINMLDKDIKLK